MFAEGHLEDLGAKEDHLDLLRGQLCPGGVHVKAVGPADAVHHVDGDLAVDRVPTLQGGPQGALADRLAGIHHQEFWIYLILYPQAAAGWARSQRVVEAKVATGQGLPAGIHGHPGKEQAEQIQGATQGSHSGAGAGAQGTLSDREGHRQTREGVEFCPAQLAELQARFRREGAQVAPLSLSQQGLVNQGRLAGARGPKHRDPAAQRQLQIHVLEVVLAGTMQDEFGHSRRLAPTSSSAQCPQPSLGYRMGHPPEPPFPSPSLSPCCPTVP